MGDRYSGRRLVLHVAVDLGSTKFIAALFDEDLQLVIDLLHETVMTILT